MDNTTCALQAIHALLLKVGTDVQQLLPAPLVCGWQQQPAQTAGDCWPCDGGSRRSHPAAVCFLTWAAGAHDGWGWPAMSSAAMCRAQRPWPHAACCPRTGATRRAALPSLSPRTEPHAGLMQPRMQCSSMLEVHRSLNPKTHRGPGPSPAPATRSARCPRCWCSRCQPGGGAGTGAACPL